MLPSPPGLDLYDFPPTQSKPVFLLSSVRNVLFSLVFCVPKDKNQVSWLQSILDRLWDLLIASSSFYFLVLNNILCQPPHTLSTRAQITVAYKSTHLHTHIQCMSTQDTYMKPHTCPRTFSLRGSGEGKEHKRGLWHLCTDILPLPCEETEQVGKETERRRR